MAGGLWKELDNKLSQNHDYAWTVEAKDFFTQSIEKLDKIKDKIKSMAEKRSISCGQRLQSNSTYTYAAPRLGDQAFAASIPVAFPVHRIEFGDDIVPHLLPALIINNVREFVEGFL